MTKQCTGDELIVFDDMPIGKSLSDYWRWNASDLLNNTLRGSYCEFIVSAALGVDLANDRISEPRAAFHCNRLGELLILHRAEQAKCAAAFLALVPIVTGIVAVPLLGEPLTGWLLSGLVFVSLGSFIASRYGNTASKR